MSRQVLDGMIIAALLALAATYLYAQGLARHTVIHPDHDRAVMAAAESNGTVPVVVRIGTWTRTRRSNPGD